MFSSRFFWPVLVGFAWAMLLAIRLIAPTDLEYYSQGRNVGYALDIVHNHHWLVQYDIRGHIMSKPPLHTWFIALFALPFGVNRVTLVLPSALAVLALAFLVMAMARRPFGSLAAGLAGFSIILAPMMSKHIALVRSDALFTLAITGGAWAAYRAWRGQTGWIPFWIWAAVSTLTKGPLGLVLSGIGLFANVWKDDRGRFGPARSHLVGLVCYFAICLAWFIPALIHHGHPLIQKMIIGELLGHISGTEQTGGHIGSNWAQPTMNFLGRFAPLSLATAIGSWRVFRKPAEEPEERAFERFLTCWILIGLTIFSIPAHHRADLVLPMWPAGALLAGRELARLARYMGEARFGKWAIALVLVAEGMAWRSYHPTSGERSDSTENSETIRAAALAFPATGLDRNAIEYIDAPTTFQMYLGTVRHRKSPEEILALRDQGQRSVLVATQSSDIDPAKYGQPKVTEVFHYPPVVSKGTSMIRIFQLDW